MTCVKGKVIDCYTSISSLFVIINMRFYIGVFKFKNGDIYDGDFVEDMSHGLGIYTSIYGDVYTGEYRRDKRHGKGKVKTAMGVTLHTEWEFGERIARPGCSLS
jgi:hypothetical protein